MIMQESYAFDLKEHLRNTPSEIFETKGLTAESIINNTSLFEILWCAYQKAIEDYDYDADRAYKDAILDVLKINLRKFDMTSNSKAYTVNFLFTSNGEEVLLIRKNKTTFKGKLNGIGGEIEENETPICGAIREIKEETGATLNADELHWLGTLTLPFDSKTAQNNQCILHYYCGVVDKNKVSQQPGETEKLIWMPTIEVINANALDVRFAGDGDVSYMVLAAVKHFGWQINNNTKTNSEKYEPTCPRGHKDCIYDPAYIRCYYSPNMTEAEFEEKKTNCIQRLNDDPEERYYCYDNEDK